MNNIINYLKKNASNIAVTAPFVLLGVSYISIKAAQNGPQVLVGAAIGCAIAFVGLKMFGKLYDWTDKIQKEARDAEA